MTRPNAAGLRMGPLTGRRRGVVIAVVGVLAVGLVLGTIVSRERDSLPAAAQGRLLVIGDSYTEGTAAQPKTAGWAYLVAAALGWPYEIDGVSGTGFSWGGGVDGTAGQTYANRIREYAAGATSSAPSVLLIQGGHNDYRATPTQEYRAATDAIATARQAWPSARIAVIGPSQPQPGGRLLARVADPIGRACRDRNIPFIDPIQLQWFTDENSPEYSADSAGTHPNSLGHAYLADQIEMRLRSIWGGWPPVTQT